MSRGRAVGRGRTAPERGAVTAELALGLPLLLAVTVGLVWAVSLGLAQVRVVDAAREAARAAARGDDPAAAVALAERVAPPGAAVALTVGEVEVEATASAVVAGPGGLFAALPAPTVRATAVALREGVP